MCDQLLVLIIQTGFVSVAGVPTRQNESATQVSDYQLIIYKINWCVADASRLLRTPSRGDRVVLPAKEGNKEIKMPIMAFTDKDIFIKNNEQLIMRKSSLSFYSNNNVTIVDSDGKILEIHSIQFSPLLVFSPTSYRPSFW